MVCIVKVYDIRAVCSNCGNSSEVQKAADLLFFRASANFWAMHACTTANSTSAIITSVISTSAFITGLDQHQCNQH